MSISISITFKEEMSSHDGYCSGGECELSTRKYKKVVQLDCEELTNNLQYYIKYADLVDINDIGSYYCDISDEVSHAGLDKHDYRITVLKVELVNLGK